MLQLLMLKKGVCDGWYL